MKILTKCHGEISYENDDVINFPSGLPGFENLKKYIVFNVEGNDEFSILHSIENKEVGIIIVNPFLFMKDYEVDLKEQVVSRLKIKEAKEVALYTTVTLNSDIEKITSNLKAPIIINKRLNLGEQYITDDDKYGIRFPLFKGEK